MRDSLEMVLRTEAALRCDECGRTVTVVDALKKKTMAEIIAGLPGWRVVRVEGWVGDFHACRDECEVAVHRRFGPKPN